MDRQGRARLYATHKTHGSSFLCKGAGLKLKKSISDQVCCWVLVVLLVTHIGGGGAVAVIVCTHQELGGEKL